MRERSVRDVARLEGRRGRGDGWFGGGIVGEKVVGREERLCVLQGSV